MEGASPWRNPVAPSAPAAAFHPGLHPWSGLLGYPPPPPLPPSWPIMAAAAASAHHPQPQLPPRADPAPVAQANPAAASALGNPLAALVLAVEQHVQHEGSSPGHGRAAHAPPQAAGASVSSARGAKRLRQGLAVEPGHSGQALGHWHGSTTPASPASSSASSMDSAASSPYGAATGFASSSKAAGSTGMKGATGAGELVAPQPSFSGLPPVSQQGKRGRRKGSKDGWNAAGAASLASGADRPAVGLLRGVHTANLDKYMPATEKVKRNRTVLANMSPEEKLARRKERARKYSQELRRRQMDSIQELLIEARRLNVFQLLVQESADPLLVLSSPPEEERGRAAGAVLFANAAAAAVLLGRPRGAVEGISGAEELLGRGLLGFVHVDDRAEVEAALRRVEQQHQEQRVRCRLVPGGGGGVVGVEFLLRRGAQGVVCNGRVL